MASVFSKRVCNSDSKTTDLKGLIFLLESLVSELQRIMKKGLND